MIRAMPRMGTDRSKRPDGEFHSHHRAHTYQPRHGRMTRIVDSALSIGVTFEMSFAWEGGGEEKSLLRNSSDRLRINRLHDLRVAHDVGATRGNTSSAEQRRVSKNNLKWTERPDAIGNEPKKASPVLGALCEWTHLYVYLNPMGGIWHPEV
jgi:hypothetical protein